MDEALDRVSRLLGPRYTVTREIGYGGASFVYLAHDRTRACDVAVKVLRPELVAAVSATRFMNEVEIGRELDHPNIVPIYESGSADGQMYFTMPFIDGETLRTRLKRESQMSLPDAIGIAKQVADALDYAHAKKWIHRDIKPGNILLAGDRAIVADFGIARALDVVPEKRLTATGVSIGTPEYMSPEQGKAERKLDRRADVYSLGCVLYEMLGGEVPFTGPNAAAISSRHALEAPRSLRVIRPSIPLGVERAIAKALAKTPADRFATAGEFVAAVEAGAKDISEPALPPAHRRFAIFAAAASIVMVGSAFGWRSVTARLDARAVADADTSRLVLFPIERSQVSSWSDDAERALRQAVVRWNGIDVVDPASTREAVGNQSTASLSSTAARRIALRLGGGRYVRMRVSGDSVSPRLHGMLFDISRPQRPLAEANAELSSAVTTQGGAVEQLVDRLLFRPADSERFAESPTGTTSLPARQAFLRGSIEVERWNLAAADSHFARAVQFDSRFARASLWLALVRVWSGQRNPATWGFAVEAAVSGRSRIPPSDQPKVDALSALLREDRPAACAHWDRSTVVQPADFASWYGAAHCLREDRVVLPDPRSPSGWRFRSGYQTAIERYRRALLLKPAVLSGLRDDAFAPVRQWLWTSGSDVRAGLSLELPVRTFAAYQSLENDTLAFVPFPLELFQSGDAATMRKLPRTLDASIRKQQVLFRDMALSWVAASPESPQAEQALAIALFQLGDESALDHIRRAGGLSNETTERQRLLATEAWIRVQRAIPNDVSELNAVRALADSLTIAAEASAVEPRMLASLAALVGRVWYAERVDRRVPSGLVTDAPLVRTWGRSLLIFSAFGGPVDSLRTIERRIDSLLSVDSPPGSLPTMRARHLARAAQISFPDHRFSTVPSMSVGAPPLLAAQVAFLRSDTGTVRRVLAEIRTTRTQLASPELTIDAVYPEAWLLASIGDTHAAIEWLDPQLTKVRIATSLTDPVRAAMLVRAMAFRAELADRVGDRQTAARWARAVVALLSDADEFLQPLVRRMRRLSG